MSFLVIMVHTADRSRRRLFPVLIWHERRWWIAHHVNVLPGRVPVPLGSGKQGQKKKSGKISFPGLRGIEPTKQGVGFNSFRNLLHGETGSMFRITGRFVDW
jgi:hypothetical protein